MMETWVLSETLAIAGLQGILKDDILCQISQDLQLSFNHLNQLLEFKRVRGDSYSSSWKHAHGSGYQMRLYS